MMDKAVAAAINNAITVLRILRHTLGITPATPLDGVQETTYSLDGSEQMIVHTQDGLVAVTMIDRNYDEHTITLDGRTEAALYHYLRERQKRRAKETA